MNFGVEEDYEAETISEFTPSAGAVNEAAFLNTWYDNPTVKLYDWADSKIPSDIQYSKEEVTQKKLTLSFNISPNSSKKLLSLEYPVLSPQRFGPFRKSGPRLKLLLQIEEVRPKQTFFLKNMVTNTNPQEEAVLEQWTWPVLLFGLVSGLLIKTEGPLFWTSLSETSVLDTIEPSQSYSNSYQKNLGFNLSSCLIQKTLTLMLTEHSKSKASAGLVTLLQFNF